MLMINWKKLPALFLAMMSCGSFLVSLDTLSLTPHDSESSSLNDIDDSWWTPNRNETHLAVVDYRGLSKGHKYLIRCCRMGVDVNPAVTCEELYKKEKESGNAPSKHPIYKCLAKCDKKKKKESIPQEDKRHECIQNCEKQYSKKNRNSVGNGCATEKDPKKCEEDHEKVLMDELNESFRRYQQCITIQLLSSVADCGAQDAQSQDHMKKCNDDRSTCFNDNFNACYYHDQEEHGSCPCKENLDKCLTENKCATCTKCIKEAYKLSQNALRDNYNSHWLLGLRDITRVSSCLKCYPDPMDCNKCKEMKTADGMCGYCED